MNLAIAEANQQRARANKIDCLGGCARLEILQTTCPRCIGIVICGQNIASRWLPVPCVLRQHTGQFSSDTGRFCDLRLEWEGSFVRKGWSALGQLTVCYFRYTPRETDTSIPTTSKIAPRVWQTHPKRVWRYKKRLHNGYPRANHSRCAPAPSWMTNPFENPRTIGNRSAPLDGHQTCALWRRREITASPRARSRSNPRVHGPLSPSNELARKVSGDLWLWGSILGVSRMRRNVGYYQDLGPI